MFILSSLISLLGISPMEVIRNANKDYAKTHTFQHVLNKKKNKQETTRSSIMIIREMIGKFLHM